MLWDDTPNVFLTKFIIHIFISLFTFLNFLLAGEIFVPRPQLLRKYTNNSLVKLWEHRKKIRQSIEEFIEKQMVKNKDKSPRKRKGVKNLLIKFFFLVTTFSSAVIFN